MGSKNLSWEIFLIAIKYLHIPPNTISGFKNNYLIGPLQENVTSSSSQIFIFKYYSYLQVDLERYGCIRNNTLTHGIGFRIPEKNN